MAQLVARLLWERASSSKAKRMQRRQKALKIRYIPYFFNFKIFRKKRFDHRFDHLRKIKQISYFIIRGVAQLVAHRIWDARAASSNLVTPTKRLREVTLEAFFFVYSNAIFEG